MRRLRLTGFAVIAILALAAMAMAGTATALEILPTPTKANPLKFTDKGGVGTLTVLKKTAIVLCLKNKSTGEFTSTTLGTDEIKFEDCLLEGTENKCTGLGDVAGSGAITIKKAEVHFTDGLLSGKQVSAFALLLLEDVHFTCGGLILITVLKENAKKEAGCSAGLVLEKSLDSLVSQVLVSFLLKEKVEGDPDIPLINLPTELNCELLVSVNEAKEEDMGAIKQEEEEIEGFEQNKVKVTVLLHTK